MIGSGLSRRQMIVQMQLQSNAVGQHPKLAPDARFRIWAFIVPTAQEELGIRIWPLVQRYWQQKTCTKGQIRIWPLIVPAAHEELCCQTINKFNTNNFNFSSTQTFVLGKGSDLIILTNLSVGLTNN